MAEGEINYKPGHITEGKGTKKSHDSTSIIIKNHFGAKPKGSSPWVSGEVLFPSQNGTDVFGDINSLGALKYLYKCDKGVIQSANFDEHQGDESSAYGDSNNTEHKQSHIKDFMPNGSRNTGVYTNGVVGDCSSKGAIISLCIDTSAEQGTPGFSDDPGGENRIYVNNVASGKANYRNEHTASSDPYYVEVSEGDVLPIDPIVVDCSVDIDQGLFDTPTIDYSEDIQSNDNHADATAGSAEMDDKDDSKSEHHVNVPGPTTQTKEIIVDMDTKGGHDLEFTFTKDSDNVGHMDAIYLHRGVVNYDSGGDLSHQTACKMNREPVREVSDVSSSDRDFCDSDSKVEAQAISEQILSTEDTTPNLDDEMCCMGTSIRNKNPREESTISDEIDLTFRFKKRSIGTVSSKSNATLMDIIASPNDQDTAQTVKNELDYYVKVTERYSMWTVNHQTGEHEFDPGPLAVDFYCNICQTSLPLGKCRIRCVDCPDFDLCVSCACKGAEKNDHKNYHRYIPIGPHSFTLFGDWNADAELLLLEGISKHGFGNWTEVADLVSSVCVKSKSAAECEQHYNEFYIHSPSSPFPNILSMNTVVSDIDAAKRLQSFSTLVQKEHQITIPSMLEPLYLRDNDIHHTDLVPPAVNMREAVGHHLKFLQTFPGYNMYRDELDSEYNNDAELIIMDLEFDINDTPAEIEFKLRMVEIYNSMLDDRIRNKRLLMHRFWYDYVARDAGIQCMNEIEKATYWRLTPLMRLHSEEDHLRLAKLIVARVELDKRVRLVSTWKSLGLQTLEDVESFGIQNMPSAEAMSRNVHMHPTARNLLYNGYDSVEKLVDLSEQLLKEICRDLCVTKERMNNLIDEVGILTNNTPVPIGENLSVVPTWDYCFEDGVLQAEVPHVPPVPVIDPNLLSDEHVHMRVSVKGDGPHIFPNVAIVDANFQAPPESVVQQSQAFSGVNSLVYFAKLLPGAKYALRKVMSKRKRVTLTGDFSKISSLRKESNI
eukprot:XP_001609271.1 hypothetical protein [Babesia bovis T2Bo]